MDRCWYYQTKNFKPITRLRAVMDKVDTMKGQVGNVSREIGTLRKIRRKCQKSTKIEQIIFFDGLIRLDTTHEAA